MAKKPVVEVRVLRVDFVGVDPGVAGAVRVIFESPTQDIAFVLPPEAVSTLETRLAEVRELLASRSPRQ